MKRAKRAVTDFEQQVYDAVSRVPEGMVTTYANLAQAIHCQSAQAVGQALKRNPFAPEIPCHRVIRADLSLGGYVGATRGEKIEVKLELLRSEGVEFDTGGQLINRDALYEF